MVCHGSLDTSDLSLYTSPNDPQFGRRIEQKGNFNNSVRNFKILQISMDSFQLSPNAWNVFSMYVYPLYSTGWFSLPPPHQAISIWNIYLFLWSPQGIEMRIAVPALKEFRLTRAQARRRSVCAHSTAVN